jgi:biofilm PGA synthesis lipoprotein PgaB
MPGIWFYSLCFLLSVSLNAAPERSHEIQLRNNDCTSAPDPLRLQAAGFTKIIVRVFSDDEKNGGLYFINPMFKTVRPLLDDWAPKFSGGKVGLWAWMGGRWFSWFHDARYLDREWQNGQLRVIPKLDLFNPEAEQIIVDLFKQLARKPIQGILIQDDLVLRRNEGFSNWGKAYFTRATGLPADEHLLSQNGSAYNQAWEHCKCEQVTQILAKIVQACKAINPQIKIGMNIHYEMPLAPGQARSWYAHDLPALAASSLDYLYLMAYHRQIKSELGLSEAANRLYFAKMATAALECFGPRLVVKIQVRDWQTSELIPIGELQSYYALIPAAVERVCFAAVDPDDIPLIAKIINPTR